MARRRPGAENRPLKLDGVHLDLRLALQGRVLRRVFLFFLLLAGLQETRTIVVLVNEPHEESGVLRVVSRQGKILNAAAELEQLLAACLDVRQGQGLLWSPHIRPHSQGHPQPGPARATGHHRGRPDPYDKVSLTRKFIQLGKKLPAGSDQVAHLALDPSNRRALLHLDLHHIGLLSLDNRLGESITGDPQVVLELLGRHAQRPAVVLETIGGLGLRRQLAGKVEIETEQVTQGVGVLVASQPPQHGPAACGAPRLDGGIKATPKPAGQDPAFFPCEPGLVLRRHLAEADLVERVVPALGGLAAVKVEAERVEPQLALLLLGTMTAETMLTQHRQHVLLKDVIRAGCQGQQNHCYEPGSSHFRTGIQTMSN